MTIPYDYDQTNIDHLRAVIDEQEQTIKYLHERCKAEEVENAKLRELVADMWFWHYEGHIDSESQERQMLHIDAVIQRMRELGVEV